MTEDSQLLQQFTRQGSQAAFSQIVSRHLNFVYSVCRREAGDAALAEDVTQVVFLLLARKAPSLHVEKSLSGWLFQTARFASRNARRREAHRKMLEQNAEEQRLTAAQDENALWNQIEPNVNAALASLGAKDREAVLLRFADGLSFPELSAALGTSEDAARMRLNRAVSRLRQFFASTGITLSAAVLAGLLAERTAEAAPLTCTAAVTKMAASVAAGAGSSAAVNPNVSAHLQGALKTMTLKKLALATTLGVSVLLAGSIPFVTRAQNPKQPPSQPRVRPAASLVSASPIQPVSAGNAALIALNKLQLSRPFTLRYSGVTKDVSTPEMRAASMAGIRRSFEFQVKNGGMTQAVADEQIRIRANSPDSPMPPSSFEVTLSSDGDKLFYQKATAGRVSTVIYDGNKTYNYETNNHSMSIYSGLKFGQMFACPLPGVALPHLPLVRASAASGSSDSSLAEGDVLSTGVGGDPVYYKRGAIALANSGGSEKVSAMTLFYFERNFPEERWEFLDHRLFQGLSIASAIRFTQYAPAEDTPVDAPNTKPWLPQTVTEYHLMSASDAPVDVDRFDPAGLMIPEDYVYDNTHGFVTSHWRAGGRFQ